MAGGKDEMAILCSIHGKKTEMLLKFWEQNWSYQGI